MKNFLEFVPNSFGIEKFEGFERFENLKDLKDPSVAGQVLRSVSGRTSFTICRSASSVDIEVMPVGLRHELSRTHMPKSLGVTREK